MIQNDKYCDNSTFVFYDQSTLHGDQGFML